MTGIYRKSKRETALTFTLKRPTGKMARGSNAPSGLSRKKQRPSKSLTRMRKAQSSRRLDPNQVESLAYPTNQVIAVAFLARTTVLIHK